jgi:hypothetical protein
MNSYCELPEFLEFLNYNPTTDIYINSHPEFIITVASEDEFYPENFRRIEVQVPNSFQGCHLSNSHRDLVMRACPRFFIDPDNTNDIVNYTELLFNEFVGVSNQMPAELNQFHDIITYYYCNKFYDVREPVLLSCFFVTGDWDTAVQLMSTGMHGTRALAFAKTGKWSEVDDFIKCEKKRAYKLCNRIGNILWGTRIFNLFFSFCLF